MNEKDIEKGAFLAKQALIFNSYFNVEKSGLVRDAIITLFGIEVDKRLSEEFSKSN